MQIDWNSACVINKMQNPVHNQKPNLTMYIGMKEGS